MKMARNVVLAAGSLLAILTGTSNASAACRIAAFNLSGTIDVATTGTTDGAPCTTSFTGNVVSVDIVSAARNGTMSQPARLQVRYQPKAGFKGADSFTLRICRQQCSNVTYAITVR